MLQITRLAAVALTALVLAGCAGSQLSEKDRATMAASDEWRLRSLEEKALARHNAQLEMAGQLSELQRRVGALEEGRAQAPAAAKPLLSSTDLPEPGPREPMAPAPATATAKGMDMGAGAGAGVDKDKDKGPGMEPMAAREKKDGAQDAARWDAYPDATKKETAAAPQKPAVKQAAKQPAMAASGAGTEYDKALKLILAGKSVPGRRAMQAFMRAHPKSALAPNALYWLGETYYHEKDYAEAVVAFKKVHQRFPRHEKAAAALLKIGYSYAQLGDAGNARFYLQVLTEDYPKSEPAALGRKRLATLK